MSLPSSSPRGPTHPSVQSSIRSFLQPKPLACAVPPPQQQPPRPSPPLASHGDGSIRGDGALASLRTSSAMPPPSGALPSDLHPQAAIRPISPDHIPALRRITSLLLPVNYPDSFYSSLVDPQSSGAFSRVLLWTDRAPSAFPSEPPPPKVIGGLVCQPEPSPFGAPDAAAAAARPNALYIQSLVLLSPYRGLGLATAMLADVVGAAAASPWACDAVYAHVWTGNADGAAWYRARGFEQVDEVRGYYFKLRPDSAWVVRRAIAPAPRDTTTSARPGPTFAATRPDRHPHASAAADPPSLIPPTVPPTPPLLAAVASSSPAPPPSAPPTSLASSARPSPSPSPCPSPRSGLSYQNTRPGTEWNDLPDDMQGRSSRNLAVPPAGGGRAGTEEGVAGSSSNGGGGSSAASSRSSSAARRKKDRYPAAAFGAT